MSYYGTDVDAAEAEASFDDPTDELEASAEADDPEGDLGDGQHRRRRRALSAEDIDFIRARSGKGI